MCKLQFLMTNNPSNINGLAFIQMLRDGSIYNNHATGVLLINNNKWYFEKRPGDARMLLDNNTNLTDKIYESNMMFGHNRLATSGSANDNINNHPHVLGEWALIHNGVLSIKKAGIEIIEEWSKNNPDSPVSECDSWQVLCIFNKFMKELNDIKGAIEHTMDLFSGSFSIFIHNLKTQDTYYFKEDCRPLYFRLMVDNKKFTLTGSTSKTDLPTFKDTYDSIGLFSRVSENEHLKEYDLEARAHVIYKINHREKNPAKLLIEVSDFDWVNKIEAMPISYNKEPKTNHKRQNKPYVRNEKNFTFPGRPINIARTKFKGVHPKLFASLVDMELDWSRIYFNNVGEFDIDFAGYDWIEIDDFCMNKCPSAGFVYESPKNNHNRKYLAFSFDDGFFQSASKVFSEKEALDELSNEELI